MYLPIWIDATKDSWNERIVLCTPLLKRLNAAIAVLNSRRRDDADSLILSGDPDSLNRFANLLDEADNEWKTSNTDKLLDAIGLVAEKAGCSVVGYGEQDQHAAASFRITAKVTKQPRPGVYPRMITKEGKKLWDETLKRYRKTIARYKNDKERMWAAAIIIYKRIAGQRNIKPFTRDFGKAHRGKILTETHRRINRGNMDALREVAKAADFLSKLGLAGRLTNEKFYESAHEKGRYYITTVQTLKTPDAAKALDALHESGWGGVKGSYAVRVAQKSVKSAPTSILVEPLGSKQLNFYLVTHMTRDILSILWPTLENADSRTVMRTLSKAGRRWVKTGTMKAVASTERFITIYVNERKAKRIIESVLKQMGIEFFYRSKAELMRMDYPRNVVPQFHLETSVSVDELERRIMEEAVRRGLTMLGFEVVE